MRVFKKGSKQVYAKTQISLGLAYRTLVEVENKKIAKKQSQYLMKY